jgi:hypothetical protein
MVLEVKISDKLLSDMDKLEMGQMYVEHKRKILDRTKRFVRPEWVRWIISFNLNNHSENKQILLITIIA